MSSCCCHFLLLHSLLVLLSSFALLAGRCIGDVECSPDQRSLLLHLKHGFSFPTNELVSWKPGSDCCTWEGVTCDSESGHIIGLDLGDRSITGYISHSLFNLTSLQTLGLTFDDYNGHPIPQSGFEKLKDLTNLTLDSGYFVGQLPIGISNLTRLMYLNLYACRSARGAWAYHLKLQTLVGNLSNLRELRLRCANMSSDLDWSSALSKSVPQLNGLLLYDCHLPGLLPKDFLTFKNWTHLGLQYNTMLSGDLPDFPENNALQFLGLRSTNLSGSLPGSIGNLKYLEILDLSSCGIAGGIPSSIGNLKYLKILNLSRCGIAGGIPSSIGSLTQLLGLDLSNNSLTGGIPNTIGNSSLSHNQLSGPLDEFPDQSIPLEVIGLSNNHLTGQIPSSLFELPALEILDLSSNNFNGTVELDTIGKLKNLAFLDLSHNRLLIQEVNDNYFHTFPNFSTVALAACGLIKVPAFLKYQNQIKVLDLSQNKIGGAIPRWIWNISTSLKALDFSNNNLSGSIPRYHFEGSSPLVIMNLRGNRLHGTIPLRFTKGCNLKILDLSDNHLDGPLPRSLVNCSALDVLDIGNNRIIDQFPFWLGSIVTLRVLILRSNALYGPVKSMNMQEANKTFPMLQILDLSSNHLDGDLPSKYFNNLKSMMSSSTRDRRDDGLTTSQKKPMDDVLTYYYSYDYEVLAFINKEQKSSLGRIITISYTYVDFSNNHFEGDIPMVIGELQGLHMLNLSHNALTGRIPSAIGNMTQLESLDLFANHLSGNIPQELTSLTFLSSLNLSSNNLSGEIPQGGQLSTFSSTSFDGNPGLCGIPLAKQCRNAAPGIAYSAPPSESDSSRLVYVVCQALVMGLGFGLGMAAVIVLQHLPLKFCKRENDANA